MPDGQSGAGAQARLERLPTLADPPGLHAGPPQRRVQQAVELGRRILQWGPVRAAGSERPPAGLQPGGAEETVLGGGLREREEGPGLGPQGARQRRGETGWHAATLPARLDTARVGVMSRVKIT